MEQISYDDFVKANVRVIEYERNYLLEHPDADRDDIGDLDRKYFPPEYRKDFQIIDIFNRSIGDDVL